MPNFKCLYFFTFQEIAVIEIKRLDQLEGAPLSDIYKWLVVSLDEKKVFELTFKSMSKNEREEERIFVQGTFYFNTESGKLNWSEKEFLVDRKDQEHVSQNVLDLISKHLK